MNTEAIGNTPLPPQPPQNSLSKGGDYKVISSPSFALENCPDILTVDEAANILRLQAEDIQALVDSGELQHIAICGKIRITRAFLQNYLDRLICGSADIGIEPDESEPHLDNCIDNQDSAPYTEGDTDMAKSKINQYVTVGGKKHWITANTTQELLDKAFKLAEQASTAAQPATRHLFREYAWKWFNIYAKPNIKLVTATTYEHQLNKHILPALGDKAIEDITTDDVQLLFNNMKGAKSSKNKTKTVMNQIFDAAVEEGLLERNPLNSRRLKITGRRSKHRKPYSVEQMRYIIQHIPNVNRETDRIFLAVLSLHPLRPEEALGLHPNDIDREKKYMYINRAVTHPERNQPEVSYTKNENSDRTIGLSSLALPFIPEDSTGEFLIGGDKPLTHTQVRRMCERIRKDIGFEEKITPSRFRATTLTDVMDGSKDIKLTQKVAGHASATITLDYYANGRSDVSDAAAVLDSLYSV